MNMSLYEDETVEYTGTFFALVRTGLYLYVDNSKFFVLSSFSLKLC